MKIDTEWRVDYLKFVQQQPYCLVASACFACSTSRQLIRKVVRSRGITFSLSALLAQVCCLICSARRFSAASRYSGATLFGSTNFCDWAEV